MWSRIFPPSIFFYGGLEDQNPLLRLALVSGEGAGSRASVFSGCGGREVGYGGLDIQILLCGGGGDLVQRRVAGGGCRHEGLKLAVHQLQNPLRFPSVDDGIGEAGHNAMESLRRSGGSEDVRRVSDNGGLALEGQLEGLKKFFSGVPTLVPNWFAVPDGEVAREALLRLALVSGEGAGSRASVFSGCGGREVGYGGLDIQILLCGGGGDLVQRRVAGGGCRHEGLKLAVHQLQNPLRFPSVDDGIGEAGHNAMESLRRSGGSEDVRRVSDNGGLALEGQLEGLKKFFSGVPTLVPNWFAVPDGEVAREGVAFEQHVRCESGQNVVGDWKLGAHRFFPGLFHVDNELGHTWVGIPQYVEAEDELHPRGPVKAGAFLLEVVEDCSDRDAGVKLTRDVQLLDPRRFDVGQDEVARNHLNCADVALVGHPSCPAVFHPAHFGETFVLRKSFDVRVVIGMRATHEV